MKIYLAARYARWQELQEYKEALEKSGHMVTSGWLKHPYVPAVDNTPDFIREQMLAMGDIQDVLDSDWVIGFTEERLSSYARGGRHVEFGVGYQAMKTMIVVGPLENMFYSLPNIRQYNNWKAFVEDNQHILQREVVAVG